MKTYLFDFDGTLVDSMPTYVSVMLKILDENNIKYGTDIVKIITPLGFIGTAKYYREIGLDMEQDALVELMRRYMLDEYMYNIPAKKNVIETLKKLKERGDDLHVLTASPHATLDPCLKRIGIFDMFTNVWSCDDFNTTKADPQIYIKAAERIGKPVGDILFLDDNYNADKTAKEAGMQVCGVYDDTSKDYIDEMKQIADFYIYDFSELIEM
ncbi:MAG: HAD family phosphatase [Ruminococcaceae bacterium]|nr:HAD family phosphatase [Oscillospiraceae bacterium]